MIRVFPEFRDPELLALYDRGVRGQWSWRELEWRPVDLKGSERAALAHLLTPVYLGEQTAMSGASAILPILMRSGQPEAQLYLATFLLDEARHFEVLTRLYRLLGEEPLPARRLPAMWAYHHRLLRGRDLWEWLLGILVSDIFAQHFYRLFAQRYAGGLVGDLARRILVDEGRHQAFTSHLFRRMAPTLSAERRRQLLAMRDELLQIMERIYAPIQREAEELEIDGPSFFRRLADDIERKFARVGLTAPASV